GLLSAGVPLRRTAGVGARPLQGPAARRRRGRSRDDDRERGVAAAGITESRGGVRRRSGPLCRRRVSAPLLRRAAACTACRSAGACRRLPHPRNLERAGVVGLASGAGEARALRGVAARDVAAGGTTPRRVAQGGGLPAAGAAQP